MQKFSISRHTVRQALGELYKEGVAYKEQGRGTFCSYVKEKPGSRNIAVLTIYISGYIFPHIIRGIEEVSSEEGYSIVLANTNNDKSKEAKYLENLMNQNIAGVIIEPTVSARDNINLSYFRELDNMNMKYLMIHALYPDLDPAYVIIDDVMGEYIACEYLLKLGHRKIAGIFKCDDQ